MVSSLVNISAAFDTIDTDKLLLRLESDFGVCGLASAWIRSYLTGRSCCVAIGDLRSDVWSCDSGVLQRSVLGPVLFSAFVSPISRIMESHGIRFHQYADDTQLYTEILSPVLTMCLGVDVLVPRKRPSIELNQVLGSKQGLSMLEPVALLDIGGGHLEVRDEIKILGVHLNPTLSMNAQVNSLMKTSNSHIRALRHVRRGLTFKSAEMIALGLVTSRLDYCNSLLYGTSKASIGRLHRVQNDLALVVLQAAWNSSSKPLLKHLHWLPVQQGIIFKIVLVTFTVQTFEQPSYLHSLLDNFIPPRNLRSEGQHLQIPFWETAAPTIRNSLNSSTRGAISIGAFRTRPRPNCFSGPFSEHPPPSSLSLHPI